MPTKPPVIEAPATVVPPEADSPQAASRKASGEERAADETALLTAGQRWTSRHWEWTQSVVAVMITGAVIFCEATGIESGVLNNAFLIVITMYFIRTNHTRVVGVKSESER